MRKAFTLLELIAVLVITGILAMISTDVILNIYRGYLQSRAINTLESQTEIVLEQIAKRLMFRIKESTIGRRNAATFVSTQDPNLNNTYPILEWISYSYESFQDGGWSGFADLNHANTGRVPGAAMGTIETPGSSLASASQTISDLTNGAASLNAGNTVGIFFRGLGANVNTSFGYDRINANSIGRVIRSPEAGGGLSNTNLTMSNYNGTNISEFYYLLHTAYAVVPGATSANGDFDLFLRYNYRPWLLGAANQYDDAGTSTALLATNVTRFNFTEANGVIVIKLCMRDAGRSLGDGDEETTVCKTKAIY